MGSDVVFDSLYLDSDWDLVDILILSCFFFWESPLWCVGLIQLCSDYQDREFDGDWFGVTWFLTYHTSGATLGHIPFHLEVYGSSQICTIIIAYWMLTETWTWSLPYGAPEIHPTSSALLDAWMPSCLSIREVILDICAWFSYGFGWPVLHVRR